MTWVMFLVGLCAVVAGSFFFFRLTVENARLWRMVKDLNSDLAEEKEHRLDAEETSKIAQTSVVGLQAEIRRLNDEHGQARLRELQARLAQDRTEYVTKAAGLQQALERANAADFELRAELCRERETADDLRKVLNAARGAVAGAEARVKGVETDMQHLATRYEGTVTGLQRRLDSLQANHLTAVNANDVFRRENAGLVDECKSLHAMLRTNEAVNKKIGEERAALQVEVHTVKAANQRLHETLAVAEADNTSLNGACDHLRGRVRELEDAIVRHRDANGHARCWLNDRSLYETYDPQNTDCGDPSGGQSLPELMAGCAAYWIGQLGMGDRVPDVMTVAKKDVMS